jgi:putative transposase
VDTQGFLLQPVVHAADVADRDGGKRVLLRLGPWQERFPRLKHLWVDSAYQGKFEDWVKATFGWSVEVVKHWWTGVRYVWVAPGQEPPTLQSRVPSPASPLDRRADVWLARATAPPLEGLRILARDQRDLDLHRHESADAQTLGTRGGGAALPLSPCCLNLGPETSQTVSDIKSV